MNYVIILAGGSGTRFWPLSRRHLPKQFLKIIGQESLIVATIRRIRRIIRDKNIFVVTNKIYSQEIKKQLRQFKIPNENIIFEPSPKNTLPAIALCSQFVNLKDRNANILVLPSDHYIKDNIKFREAILKAGDYSKRGFLCLIGIKPNRPSLGYGYIKIVRKIKKDAFYVNSFYEKPALTKAHRLFRSKDIFWNSGIFYFKSETILKQLKTYEPELYKRIIKIKNVDDIERVWQGIKPISIDYGILERSKNLVMIPGNFYWSDVGNWDCLYDLMPKDANNNVVLPNCDLLDLDTSNSLFYSYTSKRLIAALGLKDLIVVDTPDALLICTKEDTQGIKKLLEILKKKRKKYV
jgi:mannose-1-phosphate guanylyltransferase